MSLPREFIIFDTEFTSWEGAMEREWSGENEHREIVQIGAVKVKDMKEVDSILLFVKPEINPTLSKYFKDLTKITQEEVDEKGVSLIKAIDDLDSWSQNLTFYSYGSDEEVLIENADLIKINFPMTNEFCDVIKVFQKIGIDTTKYMSSTIPKAFGQTPPPDGHDALNDARSILLALQNLPDL